MKSMSDEERLKAIEERAAKATSPPWEPDPDGTTIRLSAPDPQHRGRQVCSTESRPTMSMMSQNQAHNANFIAHARDDIPWLLAKVREQEEELYDLRSFKEESRYDRYDGDPKETG